MSNEVDRFGEYLEVLDQIQQRVEMANELYATVPWAWTIDDADRVPGEDFGLQRFLSPTFHLCAMKVMDFDWQASSVYWDVLGEFDKEWRQIRESRMIYKTYVFAVLDAARVGTPFIEYIDSLCLRDPNEVLKPWEINPMLFEVFLRRESMVPKSFEELNAIAIKFLESIALDAIKLDDLEELAKEYGEAVKLVTLR